MPESQDIIPPESRLISGAENYRVDIYGSVWTRLCRLKGRRIGRWSERKPQAHADRGGHLYVNLVMDNGGIRTAAVHQLVLETFVGPCPDGLEGCHNDGDPTNNALSNVRWDTHENNCADKILHGTLLCGEEHYNAKLTEDSLPRVFGLAKQGVSHPEIGKLFGVSPGAIANVLKRRNWKHVPISPELLDLPTGDYVGERVPHAKMKAADIIEVFRLAKDGLNNAQIARRFGVARANIRSILNRRKWRHVPIPADLLPSPR